MVFKEIGQVLLNQRAFHPTVDQLKERIQELDDDDWYELLEWMNRMEMYSEEDELDEKVNFDPKGEKRLYVRHYLMGDHETGFY